MTGCGPMSSCACWPTTSSGTCAGGLAPLLFDDEDPAGAPRSSVVAPAEVSRAAPQQKARSKRTADGQPVHSFRTLLEDLATIVRNQVVPKIREPVPSPS